MIHSSYFKPKVFPYNGDIAPVEIDRVQDLSASISLNREKIKEVGRDGLVDWRKRTPSQRVTLRQLEYGSMEFWRKLSNKSDATQTIELNDFKTSMVDVAGYQTDDDGTFLSTSWFPKLRLSGFSINIGDPDAFIERNFSLVGEDEIHLVEDNKYFIYLRSAASGANHEITVSSGANADYPDLVEDPDNSGNYILRLLRVRGSDTTELVEGTDFTFTLGTQTIHIPSSQAGDVYKLYYSATTYITAVEPFVENDSDLAAISADSCSIYLATGNYLYKLQSVAIDVTLDRRDIREIGNSQVVSRGIREKTVRITLGKLLEDFTIEEVLRGESSNFGKIDARNFTDANTLYIKVYSDNSKGTFLMGYKFTNLAPTALDGGATIDEYVTRGVTLEGDAAVITNDEAQLV